MNHRAGCCIIKTLVFILTVLMTVAVIQAADFELAWDPNCKDYPDLIGYNIYYKENASILDNPDNTVLNCITLTDPGFDPDQPSFRITGLEDDVRYFFTVTAVYEDGESAMSNEISGMNGGIISPSDSKLSSNNTSTSSGFSSGCFIDTIN